MSTPGGHLSCSEPKVKVRYYRPELDAVRFLAFLLVFLDHTLPHFASGSRTVALYEACAHATSFGLSLFFALSAFLICELLLRERAAIGTVRVRQFYFRRILRIWPLYYVGLLLGVFFALLPGGHPGDLHAAAWFAVFLGSWHVALHGGLANPMNPLWSISVEEQFYLFAPWLIKHLRRRRHLYLVSAAVIVVSNAWLWHLGHHAANDHRIWFDSVVQFEPFAAGILLCLLLHGRLPHPPITLRLAGLALASVAWLCAAGPLHIRFAANQNPGSCNLLAGYALASIGSVLIIVSFLGIDSCAVPRFLVALGRVSFGLYVFHGFALTITHALVAKLHILPLWAAKLLQTGSGLCLTIALAFASYRYLETPFLRIKNRHAIIPSQPILEA